MRVQQRLMASFHLCFFSPTTEICECGSACATRDHVQTGSSLSDHFTQTCNGANDGGDLCFGGGVKDIFSYLNYNGFSLRSASKKHYICRFCPYGGKVEE